MIEGPSAWVGSELQKHPKEYIYYVTEDDVAEIDAAIDKVTASGVTTGEQVSISANIQLAGTVPLSASCKNSSPVEKKLESLLLE